MSELANISSHAQRERTLAAINAGYARIRTTYNLSVDQQWCTPDNLLPLGAHDCHGNCGSWPGCEYHTVPRLHAEIEVQTASHVLIYWFACYVRADEKGLCFLWTTGASHDL